MPKGPRDLNQLVKLLADLATGLADLILAGWRKGGASSN
jgi:hypothetical protein